MVHYAFPFFSKNGVILPMEQAVVPLASIEYSYGFGVYETICVRNGKLLFLGDHTERLLRSASLLKLKHTLKAEILEQWAQALSEKLQDGNYNLKILLIGAKQEADVTLAMIPLQPRFPEKRWYKQGVETITVAFERPIPTAKTLNMLRSYLAQREATERGCYEALSLHADGCIYEGTRSNFYAVQGEAVITPPRGTILEGITKTHVLALARAHGIDVREERIPAAEIPKFDGAFLTSSSAKVMPIRKIDDHEFAGIPETTTKLMNLYDELLRTEKPEIRDQ